MENWIASACRVRARRQLFVWALLAFLGILTLVTNGRYVRNFVEGPYAIDGKGLDEIADVDSSPKYFVTVEAAEVLNTGIQEITTTTRNGVKEGSSVSAGYYALVVGDRFLIVKSPDKPQNRVKGELTRMPYDLAGQLFSGDD